MTPSVELLAHTPEPVRTMALAARLCYTQGQTIKGINDGLTDSMCQKLVEKIISNGHNGVLEHAVFTFGVEGVSRDFTHQMVRHRNTSYDQQSLHYTVMGENFEVVAPAGLTDKQRARRKALHSLAYKVYKEEIEEGVAKEDARANLPGGIETKIIMTANLRQWMAFVSIRACVVNCHEITVVAHKVKNHLADLMPFLAPHLGPTCLTEKVCYEGKKFCGAPWAFPCRVTGNGINKVILDKEEAKSWKPKH